MTSGAATEPAPRNRVPGEFPVRIAPPDLSHWRAGNFGLPGFIQRKASTPGPHLMIVSLMHGNEFSGAIVLDRLLRQGLTPQRGTLTLGFINLAAFDRFDPTEPTASRFIDEDLNRIWDEALLRGGRDSHELARARQIRPFLNTVDVLLDLHSMLWPSDPLLLAGSASRGLELARRLPLPGLVVVDSGHAGGRRLIDHPHFVAPGGSAIANLLEAGQHWQEETVTMTEQTVLAMLALHGMIDAPAAPARASRRIAMVTHTISPTTGQFAFVAPYHGGQVIPSRNTLIALDGTAEIRTPYDDCLLVMPSLRASRGHTAVRLARIEAG